MMRYFFLHPSSIALITHMLIVVILAIRVIMKRPATGVALAWLLLIAGAPFVGALIYLLIGERRIGHRRAHGLETLRMDYRQIADASIREGLTNVDWSRHGPDVQGLNQLGRKLVGIPTVRGSSYQLQRDTQEILEAIARDVDSAQKSVLMEFYIWQQGGKADEVLEALIRAAGRGIYCCVLIDALGARPWWKSKQPQRLRDAGVHLRPALPVGLFRTLIGRTDLRLHRKIVVIDGQVAWTGSMNLVDPRFFKQDSGVGQWVDAMVRLHGSVVVPLALTMIGDWILETGEPLEELIRHTGLDLAESEGPADIQVVPSGPGESGDGLLQMVLAIVNAARHEVVLTTPYLVPDDSLLRALRGAAARGVKVRLIVPERVDSLLTRYASRSYFDDLLGSGVQIYLYRDGLLHTKSITVDGAMSMFGTVNLDMRSIWLNYEVALFVYDQQFASALRVVQQSYLDDSDSLDPEVWAR
ncbi:MAG: cardiolipin synthase, partial [Planctomycetes bacterium]|nr:cardiolipin synthase [Planctomycetota bacterium]